MPLFIGGLLYYVIAPQVSFVTWIDNLFELSIARPTLTNTFFVFIRNHLLDMLWSYSFMFTVNLLLGNNRLIKSLLITLLSSVVLECIQLLPTINMTFDWWDIFAEGIAVCVAYIVIRLFGGTRNEYKNP